MLRFLGHLTLFLFLTLTTQIGGIAWLIALGFRRKLLTFLIAYTGLSLITTQIAPMTGRIPVSCWENGPLQVQSWFYCALNRHYVTPEMADLLHDTAAKIDAQHPGTITLMLDGNFPFFDGFPLLPHLSHDDGDKADLAFYYRNDTGYLPGQTRSPIGYFAFEEGDSDCPAVWPTLRWDLGILQPLWRDLDLDPVRNRAAILLLANDPRVGKIFVEPHIRQSLGVSHPNIRFQGCRAARHDDHIHVQLR